MGLVCATSAAAEAQDAAGPASRALFGSDSGDPNSRQKAYFSLSFNAINVSKLALGSQLEVPGSRMQPKGLSSVLDGALSYRRRTKRMLISADVASVLQYYSQISDTIGDHGGGVTLQLPLRHRTQLSASQRFTHFQSYQLPVLPGLRADLIRSVAASNITEAVSLLEGRSLATNLGLTHRLNRRSSVDLTYDLRSVNYVKDEPDLRTWGAGGRFTHRLTRAAVLHVGYGERLGRYRGSFAAETIRIHDLVAGIDYSRSLSRSTTVSVTPGSSIAVGREGRKYQLTGETLVNRRLGRSWNARVLYRRSLQLVEGFDEPFLLDSASASLGGYLGRRLELATSADYSTGEIGSPSRGSYSSCLGSARASFAIDRHWAVSLDYVYYHHRFVGDIMIPSALAAALNRHSMRVGLRWWKPFLR